MYKARLAVIVLLLVMVRCRTAPYLGDTADAAVAGCPFAGTFDCSSVAHGSATLTTKDEGNAGCYLQDRSLLISVAFHIDGSLGDGIAATPGGSWTKTGTQLTAKVTWCVEGAPPNCLSNTDTFTCVSP